MPQSIREMKLSAHPGNSFSVLALSVCLSDRMTTSAFTAEHEKPMELRTL
jgi:hypothetical protein